MRKGSNLFGFLMAIVSLTVIGIILAFGYLLAGEKLVERFRNQPLAMEQRALHPVGSGGGGAASFDEDEVVNGLHVQTGLIYAEGFDVVRGTCTACHSAKLITQNRATREGWTEMIRWMQAKQGLWDLGKNEPIILDYLATNYAPGEIGRRANIDVESIEWYVLDLEGEETEGAE